MRGELRNGCNIDGESRPRLFGSAGLWEQTTRESKRYLFYSHDGVGLGHTARNLAIARALIERDPSATILLATGSDDALQLGVPERVEILKLPSLRKISNERYGARRLLVSEDQIHSLRSALLAGSVRSFRPHVILVDKHPLGAGGELRDALAALKQQGGKAVLGLRDILDEPAVVAVEWARHSLASHIVAFYDRVLIYGEAHIFDPIREYQLPSLIEQRSVFCGYVIKDSTQRYASTSVAVAPFSPSKPCVVATVGGGEDGTEILVRFLRACVGAPWTGVAITGPHAPVLARSVLRDLSAESGAAVLEFVPNLWAQCERLDAVVCMGGYNTLCEGLAHGVPLVCVPRTHPRREQLLRAERFARLGLLEAIDPASLTAESFRAAIERALSRPRNSMAGKLNVEGAQTAAAELSRTAQSAESMSPLLNGTTEILKFAFA